MNAKYAFDKKFCLFTPTIFCIPPPPVTLHLEKQVVWFFHFFWYPPILTVVCLTALKRFMVHNHSGCTCFQMGILHFHRNHRSIIAIIAWYYTIIGISIQLSPIVVALPLPSSTSTTSSSRNVLFVSVALFLFLHLFPYHSI